MLHSAENFLGTDRSYPLTLSIDKANQAKRDCLVTSRGQILDNGHRHSQDDDTTTHHSFEVIYSREMQGKSTRSFESFTCDFASEDSLHDSLGDFGYDDDDDARITDQKKKSKKKSRNENETKVSTKKDSKFKLKKPSKRSMHVSLSSLEHELKRQIELPMNRRETELVDDESLLPSDNDVAALINDILGLQHELSTLDIDVIESGEINKTFTVCAQTMAEVQGIFSKLTIRPTPQTTTTSTSKCYAT